MVNFFREHKSVRNSILAVVVVLFCLGAIFNGSPSNTPFQVGKRQLDMQRLQSQFQQLAKHYPDVDKKILQESLIQNELQHLKHYQHIEEMGLKPTASQIKNTLKEILPKDQSLKTFAKSQGLNQKQLLQTLSDQIAFNQLMTIIESSSFVTPKQIDLHQHSLKKTKHYLKVDLSSAQYQEDPQALKTMYQQQRPTKPQQYIYQYVDITPKRLKLPNITETIVQDYFKEHEASYTDFNLDYQATTYKPSSTNQPLHKSWPSYIQEQLNNYKAQHPNLAVSSENFQKKASNLPKHHQILSGMKQGEHRIIQDGDTLLVLSLIHKESTHSINPLLKTKLEADCERSVYSHLLQEKLKTLADDAYTHPTSLQDFSKKHNLKLKEGISDHTQLFESQINDPDFTDKHYISDPIKVDELHYRFFQINHIEPESPLSYEEAKPILQDLYETHVLHPMLVEKLNQASTLDEIKNICAQYKMHFEHTNDKTSPLPLDTVFPTLHNPNPTAQIEKHWVFLESIHYDDTKEPVEQYARKLDSETFFHAID